MIKFWEEKSLDEMTKEEWESLCDRCGKCCLNKIQYEGNKHVIYTNVTCKLFDLKKCSCANYKNRKALVKDCIQLTPEEVKNNADLPSTCAYRLIHNRKPLKPWHHLISGSYDTVFKQESSILKNKITDETNVSDDDLDRHIVRWVEPDSLA